MASSAAPIQVIFFGPDLAKLSEMGEQAKRLAEEIPGFYQVTTSWAQTLPQLQRGGRPRAGAGARPHGRRRGRPGVLRPQGRPHQRVLPAGQQATVHDPAPVSRRTAARRGRPRPGQDRRQEGRGRAAQLGGAARGAPRADADRARQLPPGRCPSSATTARAVRPAWSSRWTSSWPPTRRSNSRRATAPSSRGHDADGGIVPAPAARALPGGHLHVPASGRAVPEPDRALQHDRLALAHGSPGSSAASSWRGRRSRRCRSWPSSS